MGCGDCWIEDSGIIDLRQTQQLCKKEMQFG